MSDQFWTQCAFAFRCTSAERALLGEAFAAAQLLSEETAPDEPVPALLAAFPPRESEDRWSGFRAIFPDPDAPHFGAMFVPRDTPEHPSPEVAIFGNLDFEPEAIAQLIQHCCRATLAAKPIGFEWADSCSAPTIDAFGGGWCAIFADRIIWESTSTALALALDGYID